MEGETRKHETAKDAKNLKKFREALRGWMTSGDGQDYCPACWLKYLDKLGKLEAEHANEVFIPSRNIGDPGEVTEPVSIVAYAKKDANPTAQHTELRRCSDGWLVLCENYADCHQEVVISDA